MSAIPLKADIHQRVQRVCLVPLTDITQRCRNELLAEILNLGLEADRLQGGVRSCVKQS